MKTPHTPLLLAVATLVFFGCSRQASAAEYYPLTVNSRWEYETEVSQEGGAVPKASVVVRIEGTTEIDKQTTIRKSP